MKLPVDSSRELLHLAIATLVLSFMLNTVLSKRLDSFKPHARKWRLGPLYLSYSQISLGFHCPEQEWSTGSLLWDPFWCLALFYSLWPPICLFYLKDNYYLLNHYAFFWTSLLIILHQYTNSYSICLWIFKARLRVCEKSFLSRIQYLTKNSLIFKTIVSV